jgi:lysophospholipase L1-like esterase
VRRPLHILVLALLVIGLWPPAAARAATASPPGDVYLALGDSLALGVEAPANNDGLPGYPDLLFARLQELNPALTMQNTGVSGETSATMLSGGQLAAAENAIASARSAGQCVGVITLDIGGNDFGQILTGDSAPETAIPQFEANLNTILGRLTSAAHNQVAGCAPRMAIMDYYNPYPGLPIPPSNQPLANIYLPRLNGIIRSAAAAHGLAVANVEAAFQGREPELVYVNQGIYTNPLLRLPFTPWFAGNVDFHPRPDGHQVIADEFWQALAIVPTVPALIELPDLILANVALVAPWTCGECALGGRQQAALQALPEPDSRSFEWLAAQLWNRITRPILCWLLGMFQAGLNVYAGTLNTIFIPAVNQFYRLLFGLFFWLTSAVQAWWYLGEDVRMQLWGIRSALASQGQTVTATVATSDELAAAVVAGWVAVFTGVVQPWRYLLTLFVGTAGQIITVISDLDTYKPAVLVELQDFWLFAALKGTARGLFESKIGWWLGAEIGLLYLAAGLAILDETAEV